MKRETFGLIKVKSFNALLHRLTVRICCYLKSVMRHKYLILDTYHPYNPYLRKQGCENQWLFF